MARIGWVGVSVAAALVLSGLAAHRGEPVSTLWLVVAAVCVFAIAYRFYSRFVARSVLVLDDARETPAHRRNDGLDYVPTQRVFLFGHHFAAIAGPGPLIGPVLAAQMGYLPATLWILVGAVFAGAVQDFVILFLSTRRDARSLGEMVRMEMGGLAGWTAMLGVLGIMLLLLAVLGLIVTKALASSPWGCFTVFATLPIAMLMGVYMRHFRPGRILEVSVIGFLLLIAAVWFGGVVAATPAWAATFTFSARQIAWMLIGYGAFASILPVWLVLAPRDYLSTFLKIGTVVLLAVAIAIVAPRLQMPAVTRFVDGTGPVFTGKLFPFLFITIACGAVSGFHSLVSSGTTPKMLDRETDARFIGYGAMLMESFVAVMALAAACSLDPGIYFSMNAPAALIGTTPEAAAQVVSGWGFAITPDQLKQAAADIGETSVLSRAGGAPTLAVGMASILRALSPGRGTMAFWYHYAILFEALFILTTLDAGTRIGRFMVQDFVGAAFPAFRRTESWAANVLATGVCVGGWGFMLYRGVLDPMGGINSLWPLFGIANQMLAGIALLLATTALVKMKRQRFAWVTGLPLLWLLLSTLDAGGLKVFSADPKIGFLAHAQKFSAALAQQKLVAPAKSLLEMQRIVGNDRLDAMLALLFMTVVVIVALLALHAMVRGMRAGTPTAVEGLDAVSATR